MVDSGVVDGRQSGDRLAKDVARLGLREGASTGDVVKKVFARGRALHHDQKTVELLKVVDEVDNSVDVCQPLKQRDLGWKKAAVYLRTASAHVYRHPILWPGSVPSRIFNLGVVIRVSGRWGQHLIDNFYWHTNFP